MCGICGIVYSDQDHPPDKDALASMTHALRFRGPDDQGTFLAPGVGLGHRRLGVIDPVKARQPMGDLSTAVVSFNGEIYNFPELQRALVDEGAHFETRSDTEVLLKGFLHWGVELFPKLNGMFAFAIWDAKAQTLFLCRDRLGVKPLYWTALEDSLVFGSTLDSVIANPKVPRNLNSAQFRRYMALGYVAGEESILKGIFRLPPGHFLQWRRGETPTLTCWWDLATRWQNKHEDRRPFPEIEEEFQSLLQTAVRDRLISDVPLGAFLSGGLDSSTIVSLMRKEVSSLETFSMGFSDPSYNELPFAREVAKRLGTEHFDEIAEGFRPDLLTEVAEHFDEPFADTSMLPTYSLSKMARRRVTVALSGDGGDELLAGYVTHIATDLHRITRRMPPFLTALARQGAELIPDSSKKVSWNFKVKQFLRGTSLSNWAAHAWWRMLLTSEKLDQILDLSEDASAFTPFQRAFAEVPNLESLERFLYVDYRTWLVDDILTKVDRASMAHGLEVRSPFLDHRLVEFCARLPAALKLKGRTGKILLRRIARDKVPAVAIQRRKSGFNAPVSRWLGESWSELFQDSLESVPHPLKTPFIRELWNEHVSGKRDHGSILFTTLMGLLWLRKTGPSF